MEEETPPKRCCPCPRLIKGRSGLFWAQGWVHGTLGPPSLAVLLGSVSSHPQGRGNSSQPQAAPTGDSPQETAREPRAVYQEERRRSSCLTLGEPGKPARWFSGGCSPLPPEKLGTPATWLPLTHLAGLEVLLPSCLCPSCQLCWEVPYQLGLLGFPLGYVELQSQDRKEFTVATYKMKPVEG